jgi:hypothetical protein
MNDAAALPAQPHDVAFPPEDEVEVAEGVEGVEVGKSVVQAAAKSPCEQPQSFVKDMIPS